MTALSPRIPRRSDTPARVQVRADEAVISQWLLDQTRTTMTRTRAARTTSGRPRRRAAAAPGPQSARTPHV
ncbi:hypothetical protein OJ998_13850 [Solirubrobacter taibaiensis]|nr:hypothetical protein [Solirubrobacter taibaiensis]